MEYIPDNWIVLKITRHKEGDTFYKVLAGWSGGYLTGDNWRMNSGIEEIIDDDTHYIIRGYSGSIYRCPKDGETLRMNISGIYEKLKNLEGFDVERVSLESMKDEFIK